VTTTAKEHLCVALDGSDRTWILSAARSLADHAGWLKIGLEAFTAHGPQLVEEVADTGARVFLDLKLHDIPATVRRAAANCAGCGAQMLTVHASGGRAMLEAAVEGVHQGAHHVSPKVVAVTVLTSLDRMALDDFAIKQQPHELVLSCARLAQSAGLDGVVASPREATSVRSECGKDFLVVTPGIRPEASANDDQRRVLTPSEAMTAGADILVVGRPITRAADPVEAVRRILGEMAAAI
jgi:orotidine-5'-phosphate decarboxylase